MMKCMLIDEDGASTMVDVDGPVSINGKLGSDAFDGLRLSDDAVVFVDDTGLFKELPANLAASILATETRKVPTVLVGKALVCGVREDGEDADVPDWVVSWKMQLDIETTMAENN